MSIRKLQLILMSVPVSPHEHRIFSVTKTLPFKPQPGELDQILTDMERQLDHDILEHTPVLATEPPAQPDLMPEGPKA